MILFMLSLVLLGVILIVTSVEVMTLSDDSTAPELMMFGAGFYIFVFGAVFALFFTFTGRF